MKCDYLQAKLYNVCTYSSVVTSNCASFLSSLFLRLFLFDFIWAKKKIKLEIKYKWPINNMPKTGWENAGTKKKQRKKHVKEWETNSLFKKKRFFEYVHTRLQATKHDPHIDLHHEKDLNSSNSNSSTI